MDLKAHIRAVPDFPKPGILFRDVTPLLAHPAALAAALDQFRARVEPLEVDVIAGIESRGFLFGLPLALQLHLPFVPLRKAGKLPGPGLLRRSFELEYGSASLEVRADLLRGRRRTAVIDDLLATGGTALAAAQLCEDAGCEVVALGFLIELDGLDGREKLAPRQVFSLLRYGAGA